MKRKIILIGVGNDLRGDDGIGKEFIQRFNLEGIDKFYVPFLDIDIAEKLKEYDVVIFVDASIKEDNFKLSKIEEDKTMFTFSHYPSYKDLITLVKQFYNPNVCGYILEIGGKDFDYKSHLSNKAKNNIQKAQKFLEKFLLNGGKNK
ncbi:MAG: hydrogenase maturation protease [bacterium]